MSFNQTTSFSTAEALEQAAARIGLSPDDMADLLESGLGLEDLVVYVHAVISNRMH